MSKTIFTFRGNPEDLRAFLTAKMKDGAEVTLTEVEEVVIESEKNEAPQFVKTRLEEINQEEVNN